MANVTYVDPYRGYRDDSISGEYTMTYDEAIPCRVNVSPMTYRSNKKEFFVSYTSLGRYDASFVPISLGKDKEQAYVLFHTIFTDKK